MKLTGAAILVSRGMKVLQAAPAAYPYRSASEVSVSPAEAVEVWGRQLIDVGFDPERPSLLPFWLAFRQWCCCKVECRRDWLFITFGYDRGFAYVEFCRDFDHERDDQSFGLTARFHSSRAGAPVLPEVGERSESQVGHAAALERAERHTTFTSAAEYNEWDFEAYRE